MLPRLIAAALLPCLAAAPAHANPQFQPCTVMLFGPEPRSGEVQRPEPRSGEIQRPEPRSGEVQRSESHSGEDQVAEALRQIAAHGCVAGDPLVVVGTHFQPAVLAAALCRRGAGVQISDMPATQDHTRQIDCEYPGRPRARWGVPR